MENLKNLSERIKKVAIDYYSTLPKNYADYLKKGGRLVLKNKNGSKIHIKKANRGKFTASSKAAGQSVQEHAKSVLSNPNATPLQKKRANFARNAKAWSKK